VAHRRLTASIPGQKIAREGCPQGVLIGFTCCVAPNSCGKMTFKGQSLHFGDVRVVSAIPLIATKSRASRHFGFGPNRVRFALRKNSELFRQSPACLCDHEVVGDDLSPAVIGVSSYAVDWFQVSVTTRETRLPALFLRCPEIPPRRLQCSQRGAELGFSPSTISSAHSFQLDSPLPTSRTVRRILPPEELYLREKFPRCIGSAPGTGVLLPLEDGL
jgi:hypothetical protein